MPQIWNEGQSHPAYHDCHHNLGHALADERVAFASNLDIDGVGEEKDAGDEADNGNSDDGESSDDGIHVDVPVATVATSSSAPLPQKPKKKKPTAKASPWSESKIVPSTTAVKVSCQRCQKARAVLLHIQAALKNVGNVIQRPAPAEFTLEAAHPDIFGKDSNRDSLLQGLLKCERRLVSYIGHTIRCTTQLFEFKRMEERVASDPNHVHIIVDFKVCWLRLCYHCVLLLIPVVTQMKFLSQRFREAQIHHYGKRGMSWHGSAVFVNRTAENALFGKELEEKTGTVYQRYQVYYFHDVMTNTDTQGSSEGVCIIDSVIARVKRMFPQTATISLQSVSGNSPQL